MKRGARIWLLFFVTSALMMLFIWRINAGPVLLGNGETVSGGEKTIYAVEPGTEFVFRPEGEPALMAVLIGDALPGTLYLNGRELYRCREDSLYRRTVSVEIVPEAGNNMFSFVPEGMEEEKELLTGQISVMKIMLGSAEVIGEACSLYRGIEALCYGICLTLIFCSLVLFLCRRSESYLPAFIVVSLASLLVVAIDQYAPLFGISQRMFSRIRSPLFICPVVLTAAVSIYLIDDSVSKRIRSVLTFQRVLIITLLLVLLQSVSSYNFNYVIRILLVFPLLCSFAHSDLRDGRSLYFLTAGYGLSEGARVSVYLVNTLKLFRAGPPMMMLRTTQIGYLFYLVFAWVCVLMKFADKFTQAEELAHELDRKVERRTEQLHEANLQMQRSHEREHRVMTQILHDLRTPIFHLQGCLDMLEDQGPSADLYSLMRDRLDYLKNLSENLFLAAKLEENAVRFNCHQVDLGDVAAYVTESAAIAAKKKDIRVRLVCPEKILITSDGFRVRQILENLTDNAVKYTENGGEVVIRAMAGQENVSISVENTGKPMTEEVRAHLFERFRHGGDSTSSGLGLYISKTLAERLGGTIEAASGDGKNIFTLTLPREGDTDEENPDC